MIVVILGKVALCLIMKEMVDLMKLGFVIVDLVVVMGGNCDYIKVGEVVVIDN